MKAGNTVDNKTKAVDLGRLKCGPLTHSYHNP